MPFLAFEGLDGSGKSTLIQALNRELSRRSKSVVVTREPGGTPLGESIRQLLLAVGPHPPRPRAELLLYQASRAQLVEDVIRPAAERGQWILCDRYYSSTLAFQCGGRHLQESEVRPLIDFAIAEVEPDLWVLVDLPVAESERRRGHRSHADRFEREARDFHERVRSHYLEQSKRQPNRWLVLDGMKTPDELQKILLLELQNRGWL